MVFIKKSYFEEFLNKIPLLKRIRKGSVIIGRIIQIKNNYVVVDSNLKSESYISINEFYDKFGKLEISTGDYVEFLIETLDNGRGITILSRLKYKELVIWEYLIRLLKTKRNIEGFIISKVKGGFSVMVKDIKCFLPFSAMDKRVLYNFSYYENRSLYFRIININLKKKNIILSRKLVVKKILNKKKQEFMSKIKLGYLVKGVVKNITSYGVFVDLGYMDGLILSKNVSWGPYKYSNEVLMINQGIMAKVLNIDKKKNRIFLGLKQLISNPWKKVIKNYRIGYRKFVRVYRISNISIFVILETGIFSHIKRSELLRTLKNKDDIKKIKVNSYIEIIIKYINSSKHIIGIGLYNLPLAQ